MTVHCTLHTDVLVYGYLKPDTFNRELETGRGEVFFVRFYHLAYLIIAICLIVNFLVTIINEVNESKGKKELGDDILNYMANKLKISSRADKRQHKLKRYYRLLRTHHDLMNQKLDKSDSVQ